MAFVHTQHWEGFLQIVQEVHRRREWRRHISPPSWWGPGGSRTGSAPDLGSGTTGCPSTPAALKHYCLLKHHWILNVKETPVHHMNNILLLIIFIVCTCIMLSMPCSLHLSVTFFTFCEKLPEKFGEFNYITICLPFCKKNIGQAQVYHQASTFCTLGYSPFLWFRILWYQEYHKSQVNVFISTDLWHD